MFIPKTSMMRAFIYSILLLLAGPAAYTQTFYVSTTGNDVTGTGTNGNPWASITHALDQVSDGSLILVKPGTYSGRVRMRGSFATGVEVRSQVAYKAVMRHSSAVFTFYEDNRGCNGITLSGFDIAHNGPGAGGLVVHIDGYGDGAVYNITIKDNIIHDSYNNDLLKINNACHSVDVVGNMFYNQNGSDEHIDVNSVEYVHIWNNVFFNDFAGSGRTNLNNTSGYVVIKDSNSDDDQYLGSRYITVDKNVFLNWEGSTGSNFVLCGEDGTSNFEAMDVMIENNLMIGNAPNIMRAAFGVKGCKDITFRHNTVVGDLPANAFAFRLNEEGSNMANQNISFYNNIWSDPSGTMGSTGQGNSNDFSDTPIGETSSWTLDHNLYWNGGSAIPSDNAELINYTDDANRIVANPVIPAPGLTIPRWNPMTSQFNDASTTIAGTFINLVQSFGAIATNSPARNSAISSQSPQEDILGNTRTSPDMGAFEFGGSSCAQLETNTWIGSTTGDWHASTENWSLARFPEACDHVVLSSASNITVSAGNTATAYSLEVPASTTFTVSPMAVLLVREP